VHGAFRGETTLKPREYMMVILLCNDCVSEMGTTNARSRLHRSIR
jgi:hypothetical protein